MQNQDILQTFLSSSIYIYFAYKTGHKKWFFDKDGVNR